MNSVIRKHDATFLGLFQNVRPKQNMSIAVDGADIAWGTLRLSADGKWYLPYEADIGDGSKNWQWNAMVGAGFRFHWGDVTFAFRNITYQRSGDVFLQKAPPTGPELGATLRW
jgi:hypothetical protein